MTWIASSIEGLSLGTLAFCLAVVFVASFIRGFTGFGSSLMWVPSLSLVLPPVAVVPITLMLEVVVSFQLFPSTRAHADWPSLRWIWLGTAIGIPVGLFAIVNLPADFTRAVVAVTVMAAGVLLLRGTRLKTTFSKPGTTAVGGLAGLLTGATGIPGPPVFLYYLSTPLEIAVGRASIIVFMLGASLFGSAFAAAEGLLDLDAAIRALLLLPVVLAGSYLGAHFFGRADPTRARRWVLVVLIGVGAILLVRVFI
ncbi:MAG: sulfite exporter TauE/SafE family protein [Alphaproteobacteria bacterium]|nr:sulfite exporter TauE/SafE family protein [Alphaproteobacteria bacterium]